MDRAVIDVQRFVSTESTTTLTSPAAVWTRRALTSISKVTSPRTAIFVEPCTLPDFEVEFAVVAGPGAGEVELGRLEHFSGLLPETSSVGK